MMLVEEFLLKGFVLIKRFQRFIIVIIITVYSRYLEVQGTPKCFEISVPRPIRFAELRKK